MYKIIFSLLVLVNIFANESYATYNKNIKVMTTKELGLLYHDATGNDSYGAANQAFLNHIYQQCENKILNDEDTQSIFKELKLKLENNNSFKNHKTTSKQYNNTKNYNNLKTHLDQNMAGLGELPNLKEKELKILSKELKQGFKLKSAIFNLLKSLPQDHKIHKMISGIFPFIDLAMYFVPSCSNVLEKNKDYLVKQSISSRPNVDISLLYPAFFFTVPGTRSIPPHYDLPDVTFKDGRDILSFNLGITDFNYNTSPLFIYETKGDISDYTELLSKEKIEIWRKGVSKAFKKNNISNNDLTKIVACLKSNQKGHDFYHALTSLMLGAYTYCQTGHPDSKVAYVSGKAGQGFFFRPYLNCHSSLLPNTTKQPRETMSIRMMSENDMIDSSRGWLDYEDRNTKVQKLIKLIFGVADSDVKNLSSAYCINNVKNKYCTNKKDLNNFLNLKKVKEFFNTPLEDIISQINLRVKEEYNNE